MNRKLVIVCTGLLILGSSELALLPATHAAGFNPMNMMNPGKWFGGKNHRRDDDYYDRYGPGPGGYGPGGGGYGPGYGYGAPYGGYGYGAPPGYGYRAPAYAAPTAPAASTNDRSQEIEALQDRIRRLEQQSREQERSQPSRSIKGMAGDQGTGDSSPYYTSPQYGSSGSSSYQSESPVYRPLGQ